MNSFWIILFHTYINKLKTKSFIITTLLTVVIVLVLTNLSIISLIFLIKMMGKKWLLS